MKLTSVLSALISLYSSLITKDFHNFQVFVRNTNAGSSGASDASHDWRTDHLFQLPVGLTLCPQGCPTSCQACTAWGCPSWTVFDHIPYAPLKKEDP